MSADFDELQGIVNEFARGKKKIMTLEAGCGSGSRISLSKNFHMVGIDISQKQLDRNKSLDKKILGNIQTYSFPPEAFDMIICFDVLEHLKRPDCAIMNFVSATKKNGIIVLGLPNALSVKGLLTKFTPHWLHVWVYKKVWGKKRAGHEDYGPFQTFMRLSVSPNSLLRFCKKNNLKIKYFKLYESPDQRNLKARSAVLRMLIGFFAGALNFFSFRKLNAMFSDFILVIQK